MRFRTIVSALMLTAFSGAHAGERLTLERALALAEQSSPRLAALGHALEASRAGEKQATRWPNPELEYEVENFGGTGPFAGSDAVDQTIALSQRFEMGGKRAGRRALAAAERGRAELERRSARAALRARTAAAYRAAQLATEKARLAAEQLTLAEAFDATVRARVEAGKAARLEALGAVAALANAQASEVRARRAERVAWVELASLTGLEPGGEASLEDELEVPGVLPPLDELVRLANESAARQLDLAEVEVRRSEARLTAAERVPDPSLFAGFRSFEETGDSAWVAGVSLPLPVFDTKRGARAAAQARVAAQGAEAEESLRERNAALVSAFERVRASLADVQLLEESVIPASRQAFELISEGYRAGKLDYSDVLNASAVLAESQQQRVDVLAECVQALAELESELGTLLARD